MPLVETELPPYEPDALLATPFADRVRFVCRNWAFQINPNPLAIIVVYWLKYLLLFIGGWAFFCSFSATDPVGWAFTATGFQKMIAWAIFYESMGFGCGLTEADSTGCQQTGDPELAGATGDAWVMRGAGTAVSLS